MTIETLFGQETIPSKPRSIRFKVIKATYSTLTIKEDLPEYFIKNRKIQSSCDISNLFSFLTQESKEYFLALHLDTKNTILCIDEVSVGSLSASIVHPREVMKTALLSSAAAIVFVHNHPSGCAEPSREDMEITTRLKQCCELMGIRLLDHVIIGEGRHVSFADRGLL
jgi:DNA repair protein RadC